MINDPETNVPTFKYVDDTTIYSITNNPHSTELQTAMDTIISWSAKNQMKINAKKTKEMFVSFSKIPSKVPNILVDGKALERVDCVTLLGLRITNSLPWDVHTEYIVKRAQKRLYCLAMLRRAKVENMDIVGIYCSKVRPILEYSSPVWHAGLTQEQSDLIEHVQERALRIAFPSMTYQDALNTAGIPPL